MGQKGHVQMFVLYDRMGKEWGTGTYSSPNESPDRGREKMEAKWLARTLAINYPPYNMPVPTCLRKDSEQGLILQGIKCQAAPSSHVQKK